MVSGQVMHDHVPGADLVDYVDCISWVTTSCTQAFETFTLASSAHVVFSIALCILHTHLVASLHVEYGKDMTCPALP